LSSQELALADLAYSLGHICFHLGIVQQAQGSPEMAVLPHHSYQSTNLPTEKRTVNEIGFYVDFIYKSSPPQSAEGN
jgi:hypothetical protein